MVYLGADHRGFRLKEEVKKLLRELGVEFEDLGNQRYDPEDDYPDFARRVAQSVALAPDRNRGILICGSGVGVDIVANKFSGVRSAVVPSIEMAQLARLHDDTNVISLSADHLTENEAKRIVKVWLETPFSGEERHVRRLAKIRQIEESLGHPVS